MDNKRRVGRPPKAVENKQKPVPVYLSETDREKIDAFLAGHPTYAAMSLSALFRGCLFDMISKISNRAERQ